MHSTTIELASSLYARIASDEVFRRLLDGTRHPRELYLDLAREAITAAQTFESELRCCREGAPVS